MKNCTLTANEAEKGDGGGIYTMGALNMEKCTLTGNTTKHGSGGGIYAAGTLNMTECILTANEATNNGNGGGISVVGGTLNMTNCILTGNTTNHGSGGSIYTAGVLKMTNCTLTGNKTVHGSGGGVYVGSGIFKMNGTSCITPSTEADEDKKGKNDVYLADGKMIIVGDSFKPTGGIAARITPNSYGDGKQVLDGDITGGTPQNYTKFTVTPGGTPQKNWKVNNQGRLEMKPGGGSSGKTINGADADAWKQLKNAAEDPIGSEEIIINCEITAKNEADNFGEIKISRDITIKGNNKGSDMLNANRVTLGTKAHRIFTVQDGATLTLKNITLKNGKGTSGIIGGAILVNQNCTVKLEGCIIEGCIADSGGAIGCYANGTVELTDTDIKTCESTSTGGGAGGGAIYTKGNLTINGGNLTGNKTTLSKGSGGGVYVGTAGTFTMNNCTLTGNKASANGGGGVYVGSKAKKFTMKGSSCITPSTEPNEHEKGNNDVFLTESKKINLIDTLTGTSPVARITVGTNKYKEGEQVLDGSKVDSEYLKFSVTRGGSPQKNWYVGNDGKLTNNPAAIFNTITKDKIKDLESAMIYTNDPTNPNNTKKITNRQANLPNKLILYKTSENNYGIMHVTEVNNTSYPLAGGFSGHIKINYKTFNFNGTIKQSDNNKDVVGTYKFNLDNGTAAGGTDFWLENNGSDSDTRHFTPENGAKFYVLP